MKRFVLLFMIFLLPIFALTFSQKRVIVERIKQRIQKEELISIAYEEHILKYYSKPSAIGKLYEFLPQNYLVNIYTNLFKNFTLDALLSMPYSLKSSIEDYENLKKIYENTAYRERTFVLENDKVYIKLKDELAKNIIYLTQKQGDYYIGGCTSSGKPILERKYCVKNDIFYIFDSTDPVSSNLLMYYDKNRFTTGPIIITKDSTKYTQDEFKHLPQGVPLYTTEGKAYIKDKANNIVEVEK